jgi:aminocarboxymuconate-semialdehyde decarboxylase
MKRPDLPLTVDFHVHMLEPEVFRASTNRTVISGFGARPTAEPRPGTQDLVTRIMDPAAEVEDMDARGVDMSVVSSSTVLQGTSWADPDTDLRLCQRCNDATAEWVARYPKRFIGSFVLPLQDIDRSMAEFERAVGQLRLKVANISSSYNGVYMGDPLYHIFWAAAQVHDVTVWIHPEGTRDPWFQRYALWNSAGQSIEETKVMASLIYEGVMEKFPGLKVVMAHGGGYFPHYMGRMDRNTANRPDTVKNTGGKPPSDFLRAFHYDTCVYDPKVLEVLLKRIGSDRLVMGSDYPVGEQDPIGFIESCPGVSKLDLALIAGGNAARLLGLAWPSAAARPR